MVSFILFYPSLQIHVNRDTLQINSECNEWTIKMSIYKVL